MSCSLSARGVRLFAVGAFAGTTAVTGVLATALPAVAAPVAIEGYEVEVPEGTPATGPEFYFNPVTLTNGDTAYGIHEDQPMAAAKDPVLDDENYALAEPFDDIESDWAGVVGEKAGDRAVYWEPENAAQAGYILSVFGATEDADEARAVHWAIRSLSTAAAPAPELSGLEQAHLDRADFMLQDARNNVASVTPQNSYRISVSFEPDGRPRTLLAQMPEAYYETTVELSGPVTFADGSTRQTFTGGDRDKYLELVVPEGVTGGDLTATVKATMPSTRLTVLADDAYRDLLIAGQDHTATWSASASFDVDDTTTPGDDPAGGGEQPSDEGSAGTPGDDGQEIADDADGTAEPDTGARYGEHAAEAPEQAPEAVTGADAEQKVTALVEAFVLFEEQTSVDTEVVTESTMTAGGGAYAGPAYADPVMVDTGMGAPQSVTGRSRAAPVLLAVIAVVTGLGSWALRRRKPSASHKSAAAN